MALVAAGGEVLRFGGRLHIPPDVIKRPTRGGVVRIRVSAATNAVEEVKFEADESKMHLLARNDPVSRLVSWLIAIEPLNRLLMFGAKVVMRRTAEKSGIPWQQIVADLSTADVYAEKDLIENADISYPDYYKKKFHAYEEGNLSWEAAFQEEPVWLALAKRVYPEIHPAQKAGDVFRGRWLQKIETDSLNFSNGSPANAILDIGCSTGISTRYLRDHFSAAEVTGLDLSPYFVAVAQHIEKREINTGLFTKKPIKYMHANAEDTGLPSESFDIISFALIMHECPRWVVSNLLKEARRLLKPGGTIAITDQAPNSKVFQNLPPALFILMKSTEPWLDEYYLLNLPEELETHGFNNVSSILTTPRHFTLTACAI